ncbi:MAG: MIP/aquaporin family protein [Pseudomonadota bacterium]
MARLLSEFIGTAFLLSAIVGSGIMAETLSPNNVGVALLAHAIAIGAMLYVLITMLGPISGAHFNPAVTFAFWLRGEHETASVLPYVAVQVAGAIVGVVITRIMYDLAPVDFAEKARTGPGQWLGELVATFGLMLVILLTIRARVEAVPTSVALYITSAIWFTSSTSFANPAVSVARALSDTFTAINPLHVPMFVVMQLVGAALAIACARLLASDEDGADEERLSDGTDDRERAS